MMDVICPGRGPWSVKVTAKCIRRPSDEDKIFISCKKVEKKTAFTEADRSRPCKKGCSGESV